MEFVQRVKKYVADAGEREWCKMKLTLDEFVKGMHDHWWGSARDDITYFENFVQRFKNRYWSEHVQGRVRNDIASGKYKMIAKGTDSFSVFPWEIQEC